MKDNKQTNESFDQWEDWAQPTYRTGGTQPPKSHGGLIALLLVLVIFLCGVSTALGLMNIRLFQQMKSQPAVNETAPVVFSQRSDVQPNEISSPLGFTGQTVPDFWQNYHDLPQGVYVTEVIPGTDACRQGILPGDILTAFNGMPVTGAEDLQNLLSDHAPGSCVAIRIYRDGQETDLILTLQ